MRLVRFVGVATVGFLAAGCYTLQPARGGTPPVGSRVAFDVNDAGRVALGGTIGPEVSQIEGRLVSSSTGEYLVAVSNIRLMRGGEQVWTGEQVRINPEHVSSAYERRFSRGRTLALSAGIAGGVAAFILGRSLIGAGSDHPRNPVDTAITRIVRP